MDTLSPGARAIVNSYRTRAVLDEATCPTCRAADGAPGPMVHVCEHLAEGGVCRCMLVHDGVIAHPAPWRWDGGRLLDANGDVVLLADGVRLDGFRGTAARIAAVPRMEALLRRWVAGLGPAPALPTALEAEARALVAELDAAKAAGS